MDSDSNNDVPTTSAQVATPTMAQESVMPTTVPTFVSPGENPEKFNGLNFKMWQQKMLFYLSTLMLARKRMSVISKLSVLRMLENIMTFYVGTMS